MLREIGAPGAQARALSLCAHRRIAHGIERNVHAERLESSKRQCDGVTSPPHRDVERRQTLPASWREPRQPLGNERRG